MDEFFSFTAAFKRQFVGQRSAPKISEAQILVRSKEELIDTLWQNVHPILTKEILISDGKFAWKDEDPVIAEFDRFVLI